jgi:hypothetical protein
MVAMGRLEPEDTPGQAVVEAEAMLYFVTADRLSLRGTQEVK